MEARCHCGEVTIAVPRPPPEVTSCNCSLCSKLGVLWAYFPDPEVEVRGDTTAYVWGGRNIGIHHCDVCGCVTHWQTLGEDFGKMGVNARLLEGLDLDRVKVRHLDGASG